MSPSVSSRSLTTAVSTSPSSTVELLHSGTSELDETTYFGIVLNLSANSPSRDGQASANPSNVLRPSSSASASIVSSSLNRLPSSPRSNSNDQPPYLKSSEPPGSSTTPSSEMNSVTTILPMPVPPDGCCWSSTYQLIISSVERSEEHTSELQSHSDLVCRLLLEK